MSRYLPPLHSFLNGQFVFLVDLSTSSPVAAFLTARGAIVQSQPDDRTRYVLLYCGQSEASAHHLSEAALALQASAPDAQLLDYQEARQRLLRTPRRVIVDSLVDGIAAGPSLHVQF